MKTWQSSSTPVTTWVYDVYRGFLLRQEYDGALGATNTYKASGRLATRTWARGIVCTYDYNPAGELESVSYSDGVTLPKVWTYDRRGRPISCSASGEMTEIGYNEAGQMLFEKSRFQAANYGYDSLLRRTNVSVTVNGAEVYRVGYGYDNASRLSSVSDGTYSASYGYLANSRLVETV
ncbi:MAG: hypothetical protein HY735_15095, partial [Verrucomicrobia bacterium]|nr:hypothetical protein [Verrucomicrobiota bacterium]